MNIRGTEIPLRGLRQLEVAMKYRKVDIKDPKAREKFFKEYKKRLEGNKYSAYYYSVIEAYKKINLRNTNY